MSGITVLILLAGLSLENIVLAWLFLLSGPIEPGVLELRFIRSPWRTREALHHPLSTGIALSTIILGIGFLALNHPMASAQAVAAGAFAVLVVLMIFHNRYVERS